MVVQRVRQRKSAPLMEVILVSGVGAGRGASGVETVIVDGESGIRDVVDEKVVICMWVYT